MPPEWPPSRGAWRASERPLHPARLPTLPIGSRCQRQCHHRVVVDVEVIGVFHVIDVVDVLEVGCAEAPKAERVDHPWANEDHGAVAQDAPFGCINREQPSWLRQDRLPPQQDPSATGIEQAVESAAYGTGSLPFARAPRGKDIGVVARLGQPHQV